jgi:capsid protein
MLKDLDRYKDSELRAAVVNSLFPMFIEREKEGAPVRNVIAGTGRYADEGTPAAVEAEKQAATGGTSAPQKMVEEMAPGTILDRLAPGEKPVSLEAQRPNVNYANFEKTIVSGIAWSKGIPPEIAIMQFGSSYSASRQASNEYSINLKFYTSKNARDFFLIYQEFIIQSALLGQLDLPGFLSSAFDPVQFKLKGAWLKCEWSGLSRPSVDIQKEANAMKTLLGLGVITHDMVAREFSGFDFRTVQNKLEIEREIMESHGFKAEAPSKESPEPEGEETDPDLEAATLELEEYLENGSPEGRELWGNYKDTLASTET